jgi:hypothetical protein
LQGFTWLNCLFEMADSTPNFKLEDLRTVLTPYQQSSWHKTKQSILNELKIHRHRARAVIE